MRGAETQSWLWRFWKWKPQVIPSPIPLSFQGDDGVTRGEVTFSAFNLDHLGPPRLVWWEGEEL